MGHHLTPEGLFQSDRYPELPAGKIILSFKDPAARTALLVFAGQTLDKELGEDIVAALDNDGAKPPTWTCDECGVPRTKAEGGRIFTVCDRCWSTPMAKPRRPAVCETCEGHGDVSSDAQHSVFTDRSDCPGCKMIPCPDCSEGIRWEEVGDAK